MPLIPQQTQQQQANALNPTPVNIQNPTGGLFRGVGDYGTTLYNSNGQSFNLMNALGGGGTTGNAGAQSAAAVAALKSQYGIDYNSLPSVNIGDYIQNQTSGQGGLYKPGTSPNGFNFTNASDINSFLGTKAPAALSSQTVNNTPNSLASPDTMAQSAALQTQQLAGDQGQNTTLNSNGSVSQTPLASSTSSSAIPMSGGYVASNPQSSQLDALKQQLLGAQSTLTGLGAPPQGTSSGTTTGTQTNPATSSTGATTMGTQAPTDSGAPANSLLQQYLSQLAPSADELSLQSQLNNLQSQQAGINASRDLGIQGVNEQPIATPFLTGQSAAITNRAAVQSGALGAQQVPLQQQLALAQAKRQSAVDITKAELDYNKPVALPYGAQLVNPATGQTTNPGLFGAQSGGSGVNPATGLTPASTSADILGYLVQNGVQPTRYNMPALINAVQNGATAQDIISGKVNVAAQEAAGTSGSSYKLNPLTGQYEQPNPSASNVQSSGSVSGSSGAYKAGQLTTLLQSQGKTADDATLKSLWQQYGNGGTYANDPAHNSVIYSAMNGGAAQGGGSTGGAASAPATLPTPTTYAQKAFATDFTSGGLSDKINAQNTAIGHLVAAYDLGQKMNNLSVQGGNALKNWLSSATGQTEINNYMQAHVLSANELSAAYGADTGAERTLNASIGDSNSSPSQILGNVQTATDLLSSKILANIQQYKTAYGQDAPINLNWFISPQSQDALKNLELTFQVAGNQVSVNKGGLGGSSTGGGGGNPLGI